MVGALLLSASCGAPPEALPTSPPLPRSSAGMPAGGAVPSVPLTLPPMTTPPTPGYTTMPPRTVPTTVTPSPSPTPSHAPRCTGEPTAAQIVTLLKDNPAVPDRELTVVEGPYCAGKWSFTTVSLGGAESAEPLSVVTTGKGAALTFVTAGTDVCNPRVKAEAPAGIRVLACGE
ncbi:hypothetical protein GCM10010112_74650 [Actinoplanes lobatus]|uniref:Lipoprotein n=1 Tax=Actinoplanes lobatus TaxID=113568 RepID=A0ABQ4ASC5_9ACTN|nr:hypothetical protein GCM10010112_74650 [Actinoplanes lobatus]GIE43740.1 hypothetical protein Alo02nite_66380 [Actinoplanes lobatus]